MTRLDHASLSKFVSMLHAFAHVERVATIAGREQRENDVEHSYFIAMLAWFAADAFKLPLDTNKLLRYALAHDFVEVYAGDTYIFDEEGKKTKHAREEAARLRIASEFPEFSGLNETIEAYEAQGDAESRFVKALDKIEPVIANYLQGGRIWKETNVPYEVLIAQKREKTAPVPEIRAVLEELIAAIEPHKDEYFNA